MNNKIIIAIIAIGLIATGILAFLLFKAPGQPVISNVLPSSYSISISVQNKSLTGQASINGQTLSLDANGLTKYLTTAFNSTYENVWLLCPTGYNLTNPSSSTGNVVNIEAGVGASSDISADKINTITVTCAKK